MSDRPEDAGVGALFKNDEKNKPSQPDYRGEAAIRGRKFWVAAWIKTSEKTGRKFMSLAFRPMEEHLAKPKAQAAAMADGDIPF
jgi:hypothetical protein